MVWGRKRAEGVREKTVRDSLRNITLPDGQALLDSGRVSEIKIDGEQVFFSIEISPTEAEAFEPVRLAAQNAAESLEEVDKASIVLTAHRETGPGPSSQSAPAGRRAAIHHHPARAQRTAGAQPSASRGGDPRDLVGIRNIKNLIAVASGKGGVGKSTVSVNLATAFAAQGKRVGLLDADIYGPSVPRLVGQFEKPSAGGPEGRLLPLDAHGLKVMSMGFLVDEAKPMVWRGPMVQSALIQMMRDVEWGDLDLLIIDMPPGTGDVQLTLAQQAPLAGAVIVSTPQDIALVDARKAIAMFEKVQIPILGIVENMSYFVCPSCGDRSEIFGTGGARREAEERGVPFLGEVPLHKEIRERADAGEPIGVERSVLGNAYHEIGEAILGGLSSARRKPPKLIVE